MTVALATTDIAEALNDAELIVIPSPALAQADIATAIAPHLVDGQVSLSCRREPSAAMLFAQAVRAAGNKADVAFAETGTLPYLARKHGECEVE